jgi:hypothetical protein
MKMYWLGKPEGKRTLGRRRRRWLNNIKMDLGGIGWNCVNWASGSILGATGFSEKHGVHSAS